MMTFKEYVGVALTPANQIAKKHGGKVKTIMAKDEKGKKKKYFYVEGLNSKDKAELYRLTSQAMKAMPGSGKQKEIIKKLNDIRVKNKMSPIKEGDGLWANIHKKRKSGKRMRKPGEKGAPTKQDFERARGENVEEARMPSMKYVIYDKKTKEVYAASTKPFDKFKISDVSRDNKVDKSNLITKKMRKGQEVGTRLKEENNIEEGKGKPESFEAQFKRRVVQTTKPEHKEKGYNWRIKGKDRPEISIKLYKNKPGFEEFKKQLRRVAGHEFG
jgi:hypothetical protein